MYVLLTGRPQVAEGFSRWSPVWIRPSDHQNKDDLRALLSWRLGNGGYVAEENVKAAVDIMLAKSEVGGVCMALACRSCVHQLF